MSEKVKASPFSLWRYKSTYNVVVDINPVRIVGCVAWVPSSYGFWYTWTNQLALSPESPARTSNFDDKVRHALGVALVYGYYIVSKAVSESFLACGNVSNQCWEKPWSFFTVKVIKFATSVTEQHSNILHNTHSKMFGYIW